MKKILTTALCIGAVWTANARMADVSAPHRLLEGVQSEMYNPVLSADGSHLMFSRSDYSDLRMYSFADNVTVKVNAPKQQAINARFSNNNITFDMPQVRVEDKTLYITVNGKEHAYTPEQRGAGYCWASLSPDGTRAMFLAAGVGIVVTDLQGNVVARPGNFEAPVWYGNNHIVAQNATDDGHQLQSSQIVLLSLDGERQDLTRPESMSMSPAAAIGANRVVYSTIDGRMYELTVTLK